MQHTKLVLPLALLAFASNAHSASSVFADFTLYQEHSIAPRFASTPSQGWIDYVQNMRSGVTSSGFVNTGSPTTPGYFSTVNTQISISNMVSTGPGTSSPANRRFNSWRGRADPGTVFGSAFAGEWGNSLHTPLLLVTSGGAITVNSIERDLTSVADPTYANARDGSWTDWSDARMGVVDYGGDGMLGGDDDVYITSGAMDTTPVLAVIATGLGHSFNLGQQYDGSPWPGSLGNDDLYPEYLGQWLAIEGDGYEWDVETSYTINYEKGASGPIAATLPGDTIITVPEPSAMILTIFGAMGMLVWRRR